MKYLLLSCCLVLSSYLSAQDKIIKKDKSVIDCKIVEIGLNEIKYLDHEMVDGPIISISVESLSKIVLSTGRVIEFKDPLNDPNTYADDRKSAIKLHFMSPLVEYLGISYERSIKPGRSFESGIGLIGLGFDTSPESRSRGLQVSAGYKFMRTPDFYSERYRYAHILKGAYIKPQVLLSIYNERYESFTFNSSIPSTTEERNIVAGAFLLNIGKQIVFDNFFLIDYSFGLGYGFSSQDQSYSNFNGETENFRSNHFGYLVGRDDFPIAASFNLKIGVLLK